jgi:hypothetical protein
VASEGYAGRRAGSACASCAFQRSSWARWQVEHVPTWRTCPQGLHWVGRSDVPEGWVRRSDIWISSLTLVIAT